MELEFSRHIFGKKKKTQTSNFKKILRRGGASCSMQMDGQTDTAKLTVAFSNFAKALKALYIKI